MPNAVTIKNLTKIYDGGAEALKGISLEVPEGDFFALLGPNGAGKTTIIGIISTLVNKTSGSVDVFGADLDSQPNQLKSNIGIVPQEFNFGIFERVKDIVMTQAGYYGLPRRLARERTEKYLKHLDLWEKRDAQARDLSGGMKRRLMIARALVHEPKLLILDEPTAGVDITLRRSMWAYLRKINAEGVTIILTTHYLEEAESLCRNVAIINHGEIITHTTIADLISQMQTETFVLTLEAPVTEVPVVENFQIRRGDDGILEVDIDKAQTLNALFSGLSDQGHNVLTLRNKVNRLEEMFVQLTSGEKSNGQ